ncbi:TonB-dependent receptor [Segetibacter sp. 3557_3]|uniref:SusC/RagA family TonB-linked outer membrane protein n=1 Tax=Segetibacter sp. 3557_3 TaxID=2547429 RepID=UPI001058E400|nr:TonB-dependent receptor [Segetibacter sp. 3557_3]TDH28736.1 TonB-dependent receptor [Segetibacter sp. 3557_3]
MKFFIPPIVILLLFTFFSLQLFAQSSVAGKVTDGANQPLAGITITEKGSGNATVTKDDGSFSIRLSGQNARLLLSAVGYAEKEVGVNNQSTLSITMTSEQRQLNDVVVVGYGTQRKKDLTGAIASVGAKEIEKIPTNGVDKALQGQVAGLQISTTSGAPGGNTTILVRGISSITGGVEPLFVIDGYPVTSVGYSNPLSTINPADIESVDVLKDASATAIYGSRGSNGVIIVTTKRGKSGKPRIEFDNYVGFQEVAHRIKLMDAQQFASFVIDGRNAGYLDNNPNGTINDNNNVRPGASWDIPERYLNKTFMDSIGKGTDWQDQIFRRAPISQHQLTVSGGNEAVRYSLSGSYFNQEGIILNSNFKRYSFKANIDAKLSDKLSVGTSILPTYTQERTPMIQGHYGALGIIVTALGIDPTIPVYNPDGSYSYISPDGGNTQMANPIKIANEYKLRFTQSRFFSNTYAEYAFRPGLKLRSSFGADLNYFKRREFKPSTLSSNSPTAPALANAANNEATNWLSETTVSYKFDRNDHRLDAVAGFTAQSDYFNAINASAVNFADDLLQNINGGTVTSGGESVDRNNILSFLARANYVLKGKYLFTATLRRDGSSRFGENRRWGNFPSGAIGWRVSEEAFMESLKFVSDFKLRASYGVTGNNAIGNYRALSLLSTSNYIIGDALTPGTTPSSLANRNLGWESQSQFDIGLDLSLFNNRVSLIADFYDKRNKDMLFTVQTPSVTGFTSATVNLGEVQNKGFEFTLTTRNLTGRLSWNTNFNITFNRNKVLSMSTANDKIFNGAATATNTNVTMVGQPIGVFYGRRAIGVFASDAEAKAYGAQPFATAGDIKFKDIDNNGKIDDNDREVIGTPHPDYFLGFNNTFSYNGFTLDVLTNAMVGQSIYSGTFNANNSSVQNNAAFVDEARWRSTDKPGSGNLGQLGRAIRGGRNNNFQYSSLFLYDASFFRIRQINFGYNLPGPFTKKLKIQSARIYAGITNVHTFTKYWGFDPEVGNGGDNQTSFGVDFGTYPLARTATLGVNISF